MNKENTELNRLFNDALHQHKFDVGATFTFRDGNKISEQNAIYLLKLFFNELSKVYFGKHKDRSNIHVERIVFIHRTYEGGRFIHFHCAIKCVGNKDAFAIAVNKVWKKHVYNSIDVYFENVGTGMGSYGIREQSNWNGIELNGCGKGKHKGKQLIKDTNDGNWLHDLQHIDSGTSYYTRQQQALDNPTHKRLSELFCEKNKLVDVRRLLQQEQLYGMREAQINSVINSSI